MTFRLKDAPAMGRSGETLRRLPKLSKRKIFAGLSEVMLYVNWYRAVLTPGKVGGPASNVPAWVDAGHTRLTGENRTE